MFFPHGTQVGFAIKVDPAALAKAVTNLHSPVATATTKAITRAGHNLVSRGQSEIARGIHGRKLPKSWSARYYPGGTKRKPQRESIDAAVFAYSKVHFMPILAEGGQIKPVVRKFIWVALPTAPAAIGKGLTRSHLTPKKVEAAGIHLFPILRPGKPPLLAAKMNASRRVAKAGRVLSPSLRRLRTSRGQTKVTVPLFVGKKNITIKQKFDLERIWAEEAGRLTQYYFDALKDD